MCGKFTQLATRAELVAFSQPLNAIVPADVITSTPMRLARIIRLNERGER